MGTQRLGDKWLRRAERITGLTPILGWAHGGYTMEFTTAEHQHFVIDKISEEWNLYEPPCHYSSCPGCQVCGHETVTGVSECHCVDGDCPCFERS